MHLQQASAPLYKPLPAPPAPGPEKAVTDFHLVSLIDAHEEVIEPFAVACVENLERAKTNSNGHLEGTVVVQRSGVSPTMKKVKSHLASTVPTAIGLGLGVAAGTYFLGGMVGGVMGGALGMAVGSTVARVCFGRALMLKYLPDNAAEPFWGGSRTYELGRNKTDAIDSRVIAEDPDSRRLDPKAMGALLGQEMVNNPDKLSVAHMFGHGLAYRQAAGMDFGSYRALLSQATTLAGRPVDLLLVESCLCGNLEGLLATAPYARYAVVSEEVTSAGSVSNAFAKAVKAAAGHAVTPGQLGQAVVRSNPNGAEDFLLRAFFGMKPKEKFSEGDPPEKIVAKTAAETLALIDMSKVEALGKSVDHLGGILKGEVEAGNVRGIRAAVEAAIMTGDQPEMLGAKLQLGVGDLNSFINAMAQLLHTGMPSRQPKQLMAALQDVHEKLKDTVVDASIAPQYLDSGGLTVQLPTRHLPEIDLGFKERMASSAMPPKWREFVELASQHF